MENYRDSLINSASKLDAVTDSCGEITKLAALAADGHSKEATVDLLKRISAIIDNPTYQVEIKRVACLVHTNLIEFYGYISLQSLCADKSQSDDTRTLPELLDDLNALVGLDEVKEKVHNLIAYQKVQQLRRENNLFFRKEHLAHGIYRKPWNWKGNGCTHSW